MFLTCAPLGVIIVAQLCDTAERGDLAAVRSLVEEQGRDVNEKGRVRYLKLHATSILEVSVNISD